MLTTKDVRLQGYPPLAVILSHFSALPILVQACAKHCPQVLQDWDKARNATGPERRLIPATKVGAEMLEGVD